MSAVLALSCSIDKHDPMGMGLRPCSEALQTRLCASLLFDVVLCRVAQRRSLSKRREAPLDLSNKHFG